MRKHTKNFTSISICQKAFTRSALGPLRVINCGWASLRQESAGCSACLMTPHGWSHEDLPLCKVRHNAYEIQPAIFGSCYRQQIENTLAAAHEALLCKIMASDSCCGVHRI